MSRIDKELTSWTSRRKVFDDIYEIVHSVEVTMDGWFYRVDVLKTYSTPEVFYTTRWWRREEIESGGEVREAFVKYDLHSTNCKTASDALRSALNFLADYKKST